MEIFDENVKSIDYFVCLFMWIIEVFFIGKDNIWIGFEVSLNIIFSIFYGLKETEPTEGFTLVEQI